MGWQIPVALAVMIPVVLVPVVFVWMMNLGGLYAAVKRARERRLAVSKAKS